MNMHCSFTLEETSRSAPTSTSMNWDYPETHRYTLQDRTMEPRGFEGEVVFVHPQLPVRPGSYVFVQIASDVNGDTQVGVVRRFVRRSGDRIVLSQLSPPIEIEVRTKDVMSMHRIVAWCESVD